MKLTNDDTRALVGILSTCAVGGIESIIIEDGVLRGINEAKTCGIISNAGIPKFPQKIGLSRLASLKQRLDLFADGATIEARETERGEIASLDMAAGRTKVQYRCTSTMLIKAPKRFNDETFARIFVNKDEMKMILDGIKIMGAKRLVLAVKKDKTVAVEFADATNDSFKMELETKAEIVSDEDDSAVHYYSTDVFSAVMRADAGDVRVFEVGHGGIITVQVNGHNMTLLPQVNDDEEDGDE